jgi:hypothetical protein
MTTFESRLNGEVVPGWEAYRAAMRVKEQLQHDNPETTLTNGRSRPDGNHDNGR